jgi:O-methyltransferase
MSKLDDPRRRDVLKYWAVEVQYPSNPAPKSFQTSPELREWIVEFIGPKTPLTYLEFGVAHGDSMRFFSEKFHNEGSSFFGFDSFRGLPEAWLHLPKFHFDRHGKPPHSDDSRVRFIKGWFQNTVPPFLSGWQRTPGTVLVHYDADLYGSTLFAMTMLWPRVQEYYFLMDDFMQDDAIALFDFASAYPIEIEFFAQAGESGDHRPLPVKTFGRIRNVEYRPPSD